MPLCHGCDCPTDGDVYCERCREEVDAAITRGGFYAPIQAFVSIGVEAVVMVAFMAMLFHWLAIYATRGAV